jgi:hypothetical protein
MHMFKSTVDATDASIKKKKRKEKREEKRCAPLLCRKVKGVVEGRKEEGRKQRRTTCQILRPSPFHPPLSNAFLSNRWYLLNFRWRLVEDRSKSSVVADDDSCPFLAQDTALLRLWTAASALFSAEET